MRFWRWCLRLCLGHATTRRLHHIKAILFRRGVKPTHFLALQVPISMAAVLSCVERDQAYIVTNIRVCLALYCARNLGTSALSFFDANSSRVSSILLTTSTSSLFLCTTCHFSTHRELLTCGFDQSQSSHADKHFNLVCKSLYSQVSGSMGTRLTALLQEHRHHISVPLQRML
jgi:hypothetical protein